MNYNIISIVLEWLSMALLIIGGVLLFFRSNDGKNRTFVFFLILILLVELIFIATAKYNLNGGNVVLIPIVDFIDLFFITSIYQKYLIKFSNRIKYYIVSIGAILLLLTGMFYTDSDKFNSYVSASFQVLFIIYSLWYLNKIISGKKEFIRSELFFNLAVLTFFSIEAIMSLTINFLINEHLSLVAPFWIFRMLILQLYYLSIIYLGWEIGKIRK